MQDNVIQRFLWHICNIFYTHKKNLYLNTYICMNISIVCPKNVHTLHKCMKKENCIKIAVIHNRAAKKGVCILRDVMYVLHFESQYFYYFCFPFVKSLYIFGTFRGVGGEWKEVMLT